MLYTVTGTATGIGAAVRQQLLDAGHKVISVDIKDADICADLSLPEGRKNAVNEILERAPNGLDGFVPCAGLGVTMDATLILAVNFFAVRFMAESLSELLVKKQGAIVFVGSNSASMPGSNEELVDFLLNGDEAQALASNVDGYTAYASSKNALLQWMRKKTAKWASQKIRVNAVAPGMTQTPMLDQVMKSEDYGPALKDLECPAGFCAQPRQIADVICFLLSEQAAYCYGSVLFVDGGTDAYLRPDNF